MNSYLNVLISFISILVGFLSAYYLISKRKNNKSYEPDYIKAQLELQSRNFDIAIKYFEEVLHNIDEKNPFFISSLVGLSESYLGKENKEMAKTYILKAMLAARNSNNPLLKIQLKKILDKIEG